MIYAVTGAHGFIGHYVCRYLTEKGSTVLAPNSTEWRLGHPLPAACDQADVIIHLACSVLKAGSDRDAMADLDYTGTACLLEQHRQLRQQGKRGRFIFISSQSAGPGAVNDYGRSKWAIEGLVTGKDEIIVRPGLVYSGTGGSVFGVLEKLARQPVIPTPNAPPNIQPIDVEELAEALARIARHTTPDHKYNLGRTEPLTFTQTVRAIAARSARRAPVCIPVPEQIIRLAGKGVDMLLHPTPSILERIDGLLALRAMETGPSLDHLGMTLRNFTGMMA
ncbi:NAD-dependent epimerase/dehydratase family protein [Komagataeibacter oboediens]|uniref:NAD-dependent epimerase/dehydratase family protein n=1 Tax=Komagataeibacter oboediens TaxID=65958 RepID=UPI0023DBC027|nr:NAD-dependent epimerase/dehydratase family protein [Komagataeibacter oboediens]WEQ53250.1 NAD-dependent epimerase/dehydratase family protein [Komagataeibacter oboediens]